MSISLPLNPLGSFYQLCFIVFGVTIKAAKYTFTLFPAAQESATGYDLIAIRAGILSHEPNLILIHRGQLFHFPNMVCNPSLRRWRHTQSTMNPAKIKMGKVQMGKFRPILQMNSQAGK